jgi:HAE1 family hydrophobic/amphiphilic exporter-1
MMHNEKINQLISDLPNDAETPSLTKFSLSDLPIMTMVQTENDEAEFYDLIGKNYTCIISC